jgi:glycogenin glucosyltransferase
MRYCYVSLLSTDSYLPGARVLHYSLQATNPAHPFLLLVTPNVSAAVRAELAAIEIPYRVLDQSLLAPASPKEPRWSFTFSKLHIFGLVEFDKLVFLDADMLVRQNIDELFQQPHLSAVNAGGRLPECSSWTQFNSGLLVVEPSTAQFEDMRRQLAGIDRELRGDQTFLHQYFPDWPSRHELHLDHRYNIFDVHLDRYEELFGWGMDEAKVIHFIGETKPWDPAPRRWRRLTPLALARSAKRALKRLREPTPPPPATRLRDAAREAWRECRTAEADSLRLL